jgi:hypothetical protein
MPADMPGGNPGDKRKTKKTGELISHKTMHTYSHHSMLKTKKKISMD